MTTARVRKSLATFVKEHPAPRPGPSCWTCKIKERAEIEEGRRQGLSLRQIREWLITECGYSDSVVSRHRIEHHMREHVR